MSDKIENWGNGLTQAQEERLTMLAEEASEVVQACTKILRHGFDSFDPTLDGSNPPSNREHLEKELLDLIAVASAMGVRKDITFRDADGPYSQAASDVWVKKLQYTHHQKGELF